MKWRMWRQDEDIEGPWWAQRRGSGKIVRKLLHISGVTTRMVVNSLKGYCPNRSYTPWFWSNYIQSFKRHHITRSTKIIEADRRVLTESNRN